MRQRHLLQGGEQATRLASATVTSSDLGASPCKWIGTACIANAKYFRASGGTSDLVSAFAELEFCFGSTDPPILWHAGVSEAEVALTQYHGCSEGTSDVCASKHVKEGVEACLRRESVVTPEIWNRTIWALDPGNACDYERAGPINQECTKASEAMLALSGCETCKSDLDLFVVDYMSVCQSNTEPGGCSSAATKAEIDKLLCEGLARPNFRCPGREASHSRVSTGVVVASTVAACMLAAVLVVLLGVYIRRQQKRTARMEQLTKNDLNTSNTNDQASSSAGCMDVDSRQCLEASMETTADGNGARNGIKTKTKTQTNTKPVSHTVLPHDTGGRGGGAPRHSKSSTESDRNHQGRSRSGSDWLNDGLVGALPSPPPEAGLSVGEPDSVPRGPSAPPSPMAIAGQLAQRVDMGENQQVVGTAADVDEAVSERSASSPSNDLEMGSGSTISWDLAQLATVPAESVVVTRTSGGKLTLMGQFTYTSPGRDLPDASKTRNDPTGIANPVDPVSTLESDFDTVAALPAHSLSRPAGQVTPGTSSGVSGAMPKAPGNQRLSADSNRPSSAGTAVARKGTLGAPSLGLSEDEVAGGPKGVAGIGVGAARVREWKPPKLQSWHKLPAKPSAQEVLVAQLDWIEMHTGGELFGFLKLSPHLGRQVGGQGAVVFAQDSEAAGSQYAIKFFLSKRAFHIERAAAMDPLLRELMPPVELVEDSPMVLRMETACMPPPLDRWQLPPVIVTEKGESLAEFIARKAPDLFTSLQVMVHIAHKLEQLHAAGWVHRDLKPGNAIWLPSQNSWTLIDFGCAARTGSEAEICFSLTYAPPEVVTAYKAGKGKLEVEPSADVWALGVMCWELLTGVRFYGVSASAKRVVSALEGHARLPSEEPLPPEKLARLGNATFRASVLAALSRHPADRPSMRELLRTWGSLFT